MSRYAQAARNAFAEYAANRDNDVGTRLVLSVERIYPITKNLARIICRANTRDGWGPDDVDLALAKLYDKKIAVLTDAIQDVSTNHVGLVSAFVVNNVSTKEYNEETLKSLKLVSANVFAEGDEAIWEIKGEGDDRVLVKVGEDNIEEVLSTRRERYSMSTASAAVMDELAFANGNYLLYLSAASETVQGGYGVHAVGSNGPDPYVFDRKSQSLVRLSPYQIIEVASGIDDDYAVKLDYQHREQAGLDSAAMQKYLQYMRTLFAGTEYFVQLERLLKQRALMKDEAILTHPQVVRRT